MKSKLKMLRRIRDARERMRDLAASELADAERERLNRDAERHELVELREDLVVDARVRLDHAASIQEIERIGIELSIADQTLIAAERALMAAVEDTERAAIGLQKRERELRLSERLVSDLRKEIRKEADREEQAASDDLTSARWRQQV